MDINFVVPKFVDGQFLTEIELYQLARLPLELYRSSNVAKGQVGFFGQAPEEGREWNRFELADGQLIIKSLFVVSSEGVPFVLLDEVLLRLEEIPTGDTTLFASAYFASNSAAFGDEHFSPGGEYPEDEMTEALNGYRVLLHWGTGAAPNIEGTTRYSVALGTLSGPDGSSFEVLPLAYFPSALPELADAAEGVGLTLEDYTQLLLDPATAPNVDRTTLLDRLEQTGHSLQDEFTPTQRVVSDARLMLKAAKGFYLRVAHAQNAQDPRYRECRGLQGRVLEHRFESLYDTNGHPLGETIGSLTRLSSTTPGTGSEQLGFFRELQVLLSTERNVELLQGTRPPPEVQKRPQIKRPIIFLEEDES